MKISKLFHWLYACLMLLPIFAIGVTCAYAIFNKNAKDSYDFAINETLMPIYYESNEVNSQSDLIQGNVYRIEYNTIWSQNISHRGILVNEMWVNGTYNIYNNNVSYDRPYIELNPRTADSTYLCFHELNRSKYYMTSGYIDFVYDIYQTSEIWEYVIQCPMNYVKEYYVYSEQTTLGNVFYDSVREVGENPYFAWANDSFLAEPVQYITNLFGMPNDNSVITLLSYWLAISIIYLCFDVIMYVPLLAHRWLDKGMLE